MKQLLAILFENEAGALVRVLGLFAQRNVNIESLSVAPTEDTTMSRLTLLTLSDAQTIEQITKHLNRLVGVVKVINLVHVEHVERELMLVKVCAEGDERQEIKRTCDIFRGQIVDVTTNTYTIQLVGPTAKLLGFLEAIGRAHILEVVRSGTCGITRGAKVLSAGPKGA
ncbi:MAG: acetolactate synthase small subunit [Gammaproteobacteria bacterium]|nr:acetolactate synthase small subunit [Gammaproteobacteria bacterium]MYF01696.1 acetolactate synthase small subunit [Gammaproteobacteria bacterium]MYI76548.1 acetolactate synthase small subunit [Gammaproteobacteria bacterium]